MRILIQFLIFLLVFFQTEVFSQSSDNAKVTLVRKNATAIIGEEAKSIQLDEELPIQTKVQTDGMGLLEFEYKGTVYRINKNTTITLSDVIKSTSSTANANYKPGMTTDVSGTRGLNKSGKKKVQKSKHKKKHKEEKA